MCLIIYSPLGTLIDRDVFDCARQLNRDGIGIMSTWGVERYLGRTEDERAWAHLCELSANEAPHGIHFRLATHGDLTLANCHPFLAPGSDAVVMHNGIIDFAAEVDDTDPRSDTAVFVEWFMANAPEPRAAHYERYYRSIERAIGIDNRLLVFHSFSGDFTICNEDSGIWIGDHWYSNADSLPSCLGYYAYDYSWPTTENEVTLFER